jgi:uncharacterized membrane protein YeaQ/YmgE (transglycosylase-associated protein family)
MARLCTGSMGPQVTPECAGLHRSGLGGAEPAQRVLMTLGARHRSTWTMLDQIQNILVVLGAGSDGHGAFLPNAAFYHQILQALAGETVSMRAGFAFAHSRLRAILLWSLFAGLVGLVIRFLSQRFGWVGRIIMGLIGTAWSVASVFAIPVLIREENLNPFGLLRRSSALLKKTWGEGLVGYVGFSILGWFVVLGAIAFFLSIAILSALIPHPLVLLIPGVILGVLALMAVGYLANTAAAVYRGALYIYASEGVVPELFTAEQLDAAWKVKRA